MKDNNLTLTETQLVSLIEKISKDITKDEVNEQGRKLKRQIRRTSKLQKRSDKAYFTELTGKLGELIHDDIRDVDYKKYPNLKELTVKTLLAQTIEMGTIIYTIHTYMMGGATCEERKDKMNIEGLDNFLNQSLSDVYGDMRDFAQAIPGFPYRDIRKFISRAEKLINMLHNHDKAISDFKAAHVEDVMSLWDKIRNEKEALSEKTFDTISELINDESLPCPPPVDIDADDGTWLSRTFGGKKKKDSKKSKKFKAR